MFRAKIPKKFYSLLIVLLVIFLLGLTGIFKPIRNLAEKKLIMPIRQKIFDWRLTNKKNLGDCTLAGEKEITELKTKIVFLEEENRQQKRLLSSPLPKAWKFQTVKVIGAENETLLISAGEQDNLKLGMMAITGDTYLGKVYQVSQSISKIHLPSFADEKMAVGIIDKENHSLTGRGLLVGKGEGGMRIDQIILSEKVKPQDIVRVEVLGSTLMVGVIEEMVERKGDMFKSALVKRLYNPAELETIFLIRN